MIEIPKLDLKKYKEYNRYSIDVRSSVIYYFLFKSLATRELDRKILCLNSDKTKGWRSFEILGHVGLNNSHKGLFANHQINYAIRVLEELDTSSELIVMHLKHYLENKNHIYIDKEIFDERFQEECKQSRERTQAERLKRIKDSKNYATREKVSTYVFRRNPDIVEEALYRSDGFCERCKSAAPFTRKKDNTPYLETHHIVPLCKGGDDVLENVIAVCPNCHRELHYGDLNE